MLLPALLAAVAIAAPGVDQVTDHSARVTADAPMHVEYGTSGAYGLYASGPPGVLTLANLAAATTYHVRVNGGSDLTFTTAEPPAGAHTLRIGKRRALLLDGRPFIPVLQWLQCPWLFDAERALGVTVFMGKGCHDNDDADEVAQTAQLGAFSILPYNARVDPLAWRADDEPDQNHVPATTVAQATKRGHPKLTFVTLTSSFFGPTHKDVPSAAYARAADVVGFDIYPIYGYCRPDLIWWEADATKALVEIARPGQPIYSWIEAASTSSQWCHGRGVQANELRAEVWMTLVNGATAYGYFTHSWTPTYAQFRVAPGVQTEMRRTDRQVATLTPALLGAPLAVKATGVEAIARTYNGARYVFAVNVTRAPVRGQIDVAGGGGWHVFEEGRSVQSHGAFFNDAFAPLAVHVYVLPPIQFR